MTLVIALHGNPGRGSDLASLTSPLWGAGHEVDAPTRPVAGASLAELDAAIDRARAAKPASEVCLLGYSWGCWLALHYARQATRPPERVALIAPYVVAENPVSPIVAGLVAVPLLGSLLLRSSVTKTRERYLEQSFAPESADPVSQEQLRGVLSDPEVWRGALRYKQVMTGAPLAGLEAIARSTRLLVVRGAADQVARWEVHRQPLEPLLAGAQVHSLEGAGHALPWTRTKEATRIVAEWLASTPAAPGS